MSGFAVSHARIKPNVHDDNAPVSAAWDMVQRSAGKVLDLSGGGADFAMQGGYRQESNLLGNAVAFNGVDGCGLAPFSIQLNGDFTVSMWVNLGGLATGTFFSIGNSADANPYLYLRYDGAKFAANIRDNLGVAIGLNNIPAGASIENWYRVDFVKEGNAIRMHIDTVAPSDTDISTLGTLTTDTAGAGCFARTTQSSFSDCRAMAPEFSPYAKQQAQIDAEYARGRLALWKTKAVPTTGSITAGYVGDSPLRMKSGAVEVATYMDEGKVEKVITTPAGDGRFYLPTSLTQQTPKESAFGGFECTLVHNYVGTVYVAFIANNTDDIATAGHDGYHFLVTNTGLVQLRRSDNGVVTSLYNSPAGTVVQGAPTRMVVGRTGAGVIKLYANGVLLTTLTDTTYSESLYQVFRLSQTGLQLLISGDHAVIKRLIA